MFHLLISWVNDPFRFEDWAVPPQWPCKRVYRQLKAEACTFCFTLHPRLWPQVLEKFLLWWNGFASVFPVAGNLSKLTLKVTLSRLDKTENVTY